MSPEVVIRHAIASDAEALAALAARTFRDTFGDLNRPEDMLAFLAQSYGTAQQRAEIDDPEIRTLVAEKAGELVAFAQVRSSSAPICVRAPNPIELSRLYVDREWLGRGVAQRLLKAALAEAASFGGRTLWLGVWERNPRAIAFYRKCGFEDVGTHVFQVGADAQIDRVMVRELVA